MVVSMLRGQGMHQNFDEETSLTRASWKVEEIKVRWAMGKWFVTRNGRK
jgi:hypothetical protein